MEMRIPVHSIVDVITNSSTVIYTEAHSNTVEMAKTLFSEILEAAGSPLTADDVFDFSTQVLPDGDLGEWLDEIESDGHPDDISAWVREIEEIAGWKERTDRAKELAEQNKDRILEYLNELGESDWDDYPKRLLHLVVKTKDGKDFPFMEKFEALFAITAYRDG